MAKSDEIRKRLDEAGVRYWAGDNISVKYYKKVISRNLLKNLQVSLMEFRIVYLLIEIQIQQYGYRQTFKMYINELMSGFRSMPNATAFLIRIEDGYKGMLVVRSELTSLCSTTTSARGVGYIGILAAEKLIGLSKYTRIAQWCARRGTLQEELNNDIAREIMKATDSKM